MCKIWMSFCVLMVWPGLALAQAIDSTYSQVKLEACSIIDKNEEEAWAKWRCRGLQGVPVYVAEGDLRFFVSFGQQAEREKAASQTFAFFNTINETLEWRRVKVLGKFRPFAVIHRWFVDDPDAPGRQVNVLVVTRLGRWKTCHVAYIDASANPDANVLARQAADSMARDFNCRNSPETKGRVGSVLRQALALR
ncbi:hypothetical protein [Coralliovum pocilloporae]|uniref:hypothetical protein n=1 Tax=Coralliovum pocilloporae TaxID=3066369 RepID=UPI00330750D9